MKIFKDNDGNMHIQGNCSDLLELIHVIMESITGHKDTEMLLKDKVVFVKNEGGYESRKNVPH